MYIVLTGAKKNIGDYLITDRCKKLLRKHKPDHELIQLPYWKSLENRLDEVNESDAIIIMGGPGFQPNFYPGVYKLIPDLDQIKVPIIPMGVGWKGIPGDTKSLLNYKFTKKSIMALQRISKQAKFISCRDYLTKFALENNGIPNMLMTGCPVWYDLDYINQDFKPPEEIKNIVYTPSHNSVFKNQTMRMMGKIRKIFPEATIYCSFHRGIRANDEFTEKSDELMNLEIMKEAEKHEFVIRDVSFDLKKIDFYNKCDLHIGYRVHGHLHFLSQRKPSFLIHEDGRGRGVSEALNIKGMDGYSRSRIGTTIYELKIPWFSTRLNRLRWFKVTKQNRNTVNLFPKYVQNELDNNFARFSGLGKVIDTHYEIMKKFIRSIP